MPPFSLPSLDAAALTPLSMDVLEASRQVSAALGLPLDAARGGRLALSCDARAVLIVELLVSAAQAARAESLSDAAVAAALEALHATVGDCLRGDGGWLPHDAACDAWAMRLAAAPPEALSPDAVRALDAWVRGAALLLPHHYAMYGAALVGAGAGAGAGATGDAGALARSTGTAKGAGGAASGAVVVRARPIVEVPFDVPPLSRALLLPPE